tara:strand:- start:4544 stop:4741 length:198 start_codon:yes stop_codon:yes gene_type:complete
MIRLRDRFFDDFTIFMYDNNLFTGAHSLPNYKHSIINTPGVLDTELLAKHLEVNMGKKLKDIDFH